MWHAKNKRMNKDDNHDTITIYRCGIASGADGPQLFLVKAENIELDTLKVFFKENTTLLLVYM